MKFSQYFDTGKNFGNFVTAILETIQPDHCHQDDHAAQACPRLEQLGGLASWGRVEVEELEMMQKEVKARNLNLTLQ